MSRAKITPERLAQIARRKLNSLGVDTSLSADGRELMGLWNLPAGLSLEHPLRDEKASRLVFRVQGHDRLVPTEPVWMAGLAPQPFYDHRDMSSVFEQLLLRLRRRAEALRQLHRRLVAFGLKSSIDEEHLQVVVTRELPGQGRLQLIGDEQGMRVAGFESFLPSQASGRFEAWVFDLEAYDDPADLEMALIQELPQRLAASREGTGEAQDTRRPPTSPNGSGAQGLLRLGDLIEHFGPEALLAPGVVLRKDLQVSGRQVRFLARHRQGGLFDARLETAAGQAWSGTFELAAFLSVEDFVAGLLGQASVEALQAEPRPIRPAAISEQALEMSSEPLPVPGEVWVMTALVESDDGREIRYVGVDQDGAPFGAPRVLPRATFLEVFTQVSHGVYRLRVQVQKVDKGAITYLQVDSEGRPAKESRSSAPTAFLASFVPEAAGF